MLLASALLAGASYGSWYLLDDLLGSSLLAQVAAVGCAIVAGVAVYAAAALVLRIPEAGQIRGLLRSGRGGS